MPEPEYKRDFYTPFCWNLPCSDSGCVPRPGPAPQLKFKRAPPSQPSTLQPLFPRHEKARLLTHIICLNIPPLSPQLLGTSLPFDDYYTQRSFFFKNLEAFVLNYIATQAPTFRSHANANEIQLLPTVFKDSNHGKEVLVRRTQRYPAPILPY